MRKRTLFVYTRLGSDECRTKKACKYVKRMLPLFHAIIKQMPLFFFCHLLQTEVKISLK